MNDVFCSIIKSGSEAPIYQDDDVLVVNDIHPSAPVHMLVIPKRHFTSLEDFEETDTALLMKLLLVARRMAREAGLTADGYRIVMNTGAHGGQVVPHFHVHVMGGAKLGGRRG